jgi:hypothetical protein
VTASAGREQVRAAEPIAALSLAADLALGMELEHGLRSTLVAARLAERLGVGPDTASQTYYACLLFYVGCTADAEIAAETFPDEAALLTHFSPVMFGSRMELMAGIMRALATPGSAPPARALQVARGLPRAIRSHERHLAAMCEVAGDADGPPRRARLGAGAARGVHRALGRQGGSRPRGDEIPLAVRIAHVARDADLQRMLGGVDFAAGVIRDRAGAAFDPRVAGLLVDGAAEILAFEPQASAWEETLACEPRPWLTLEGDAIDSALAAMGDFADLASR